MANFQAKHRYVFFATIGPSSCRHEKKMDYYAMATTHCVATAHRGWQQEKTHLTHGVYQQSGADGPLEAQTGDDQLSRFYFAFFVVRGGERRDGDDTKHARPRRRDRV